MKTTRFILPLFLFIAFALITSCKKKDDDPKPASKTELIAGTGSKSWKLTAATGTLSGFSIDALQPSPLTGGNPPIPTCLQDNIITFKSDKTYQIAEGASSCTPSTADNGTWALSTDENTITLTSTGTGSIYAMQPITIKSINSTTFQGQAVVSISGVSVPVDFTFSAQ